MKLRFVQGMEPEAPDMPPWTIVVDRVPPSETDLIAMVKICLSEDEVNRPDNPRAYELALRVLDRDNQCVGEFSSTLRPAIQVAVLPVALPGIRVAYLGEHTLEVALGDARATLPLTVVLSEAAKSRRSRVARADDPPRPLSPTARVERGEALRAQAQRDWPDVYDSSETVDEAVQLVHDAVHAALGDVPLTDLPGKVGALLGQVAADVLVDRSWEAGDITQPWEIERLTATLHDAVHARHFGDEEY